MPETSIRIAPELLQACQETKPSWHSTTSFVNEMIHDGLMAIDTCGTLGIPNDRETQKEKRGREVLPISNRVSNSKNKEKENSRKTKFKFSRDLIPFELIEFTDQIEKFWKVKTGRKSEEAFNLLVSNLIAIKKEYKEQVVSEQLDLAIAGGPKGPWSSITLKNYKTFGIQNKGGFQPEPAPNHPASRVFRNGKFEDQ
jgi:hypothetical protein